MKTLGGGSVALGAVLTLFALSASPAFASGPHGGGGGGHAFSGGHFSGGHSFSGGHAFAGAHFSGSHIGATSSFRGSYGAGAGRGGYAISHSAPSVARTVAGVLRTWWGQRPRQGRWWALRSWWALRWTLGWRLLARRLLAAGILGRWICLVPAGIARFCATYYWNSVPYYYYNDVYYTYDPSASGYVATTPPPALDSDAAASDSEGAGPGAAGPGSAPGVTGAPANSDGLYAYPKNGQSDEQQAQDRSECAQWAGAQTGSGAFRLRKPRLPPCDVGVPAGPRLQRQLKLSRTHTPAAVGRSAAEDPIGCP